MLNDVPSNLRTFFQPQAEQMQLRAGYTSNGFYGSTNSNLLQGQLWAMPLADGCLMCTHTFRTELKTTIEEMPGTYACICLESPDCLSATPANAPAVPRLGGNVVSFAQENNPFLFDVGPGALYDSCSICFTPEFFMTYKDVLPCNFEEFSRACMMTPANSQDVAIRRWLMGILPHVAFDNAASRRIMRDGHRAVEWIMLDAENTLRAYERRGNSKQERLVEQAKLLIVNNLDEPFSLDALADNLFVSRSTLCAAFKQETGQSLGAFAQKERFRQAQDLLANSRLEISDVAAAVGYQRQGSFTEAFKARTNLTPTEWRRQYAS